MTTLKLLALLILLSMDFPAFSQVPLAFGREECERLETGTSDIDQTEALDWMQCVTQSIEISAANELSTAVRVRLSRKASKKNDSNSEVKSQTSHVQSEKQN